MRKITWTMLATVAVIASCATPSHQIWTKAEASPQDLASDRYACIQESRTPWGQSWFGGGFGNGGGGFSGGAGASAAVGGSEGGFIFLGTERRAQGEANRLFDACMESRGWVPGPQ